MSMSLMKLLAVHGTNFTGVGGGHAEIEPSDVAAALAYGLSVGASHLGLYLFLDDDRSRGVILKLLSVIISKAYESELRKEAMPSETAWGLAESVLVELSDHRRCTHCAGSGNVIKKDQRSDPGESGTSKSLAACPKCGGVGVQSMSDYRRAKLAGINSKTLTRRYLKARATGFRAFCAWQTELRDHLDAQFHRKGVDVSITSH